MKMKKRLNKNKKKVSKKLMLILVRLVQTQANQKLNSYADSSTCSKTQSVINKRKVRIKLKLSKR